MNYYCCYCILYYSNLNIVINLFAFSSVLVLLIQLTWCCLACKYFICVGSIFKSNQSSPTSKTNYSFIGPSFINSSVLGASHVRHGLCSEVCRARKEEKYSSREHRSNPERSCYEDQTGRRGMATAV